MVTKALDIIRELGNYEIDDIAYEQIVSNLADKMNDIAIAILEECEVDAGLISNLIEVFDKLSDEELDYIINEMWG